MRFVISPPWSKKIRTWRKFSRVVRSKDRELLLQLGRFSRPVLVAGCQRSGTTAVTRAIAGSDGFDRFRITHDDELDAALILSGEEDWNSAGRYCFQTTYLNERYFEYFQSKADFQLIWVLRNPYSVVYSMLYNWKQFALKELFASCGYPVMQEMFKAGKPGRASLLEMACYSYVGKMRQLFELRDKLPADRLMVIDYDRLCEAPAVHLGHVLRFIDAEFQPKVADAIHRASLAKSECLSEDAHSRVQLICASLYDRASSYAQR